MAKKTIDDIKVSGKKVLVRCPSQLLNRCALLIFW